MEYLRQFNVGFNVDDPHSTTMKAVQWLADEAGSGAGEGVSTAYGKGLEGYLNKKLVQRFAVLTIDIALQRQEQSIAVRYVDE